MPGRNDLCPCGSGKKFKRCHLFAEGAPAVADSPGPRRAPRVGAASAASGKGERAARRKKAAATSPEEQAAAVRRVFAQVHAHWADEPLDALGGVTPRAAVETPDGRAAVIRVLEQLDRDERNRARREERPAVGLELLWDQLGLSKKRPENPPRRKRSS